MRTPEQQEKALQIFEQYRSEILERQRSNTASYDKFILTLSSSGLGLSLALIRFFKPLQCPELAITTWSLFFASIASALIAFVVSNWALDTQLDIAEDYYQNQVEEAFSKNNWYESINSWLNVIAGASFLLALIALISLAAVNIL